MSRSVRRCLGVSTRASMVLLLVLATAPLGFFPSVSSAAEVNVTEVVSGVPNAVVYAEPGQTVSFPINVAAGGYLLTGVTQSNPAFARVNTEYLLAPWGSSSFTLSAACKFWPKDGTGSVTWQGAPAPYAVQASIYVAPGVPRGDYTIPIYTTVATPVIGTQSLMLNDYYKDSFVVHVEPAADLTAPVTTATLAGVPGLAGWYLSDTQVTLSATDSGGSGLSLTEYSLDQGSSWARYSSPISVSAEGASTVYYRSIDVAGNTEDFKSVQVSIDKTDPIGEVTTIADGAVTPVATLDYSTSDASPGSGVESASMTLDGLTATSGTVVTGEGPHTVTVIVRDAAGRETTHSHTFSVHTGGPKITIVSPSAGAHRTPQSFQFTLEDELGIGSVLANPVASHTWDAEGAYTATVLAADSLGNPSSASVSFMIDSTTPTTTAMVAGTMGANGWWQSATQVSLNAADPVSGGVASGIASTWVRVDGGPWSEYADVIDVAGDGVHAVEFYSVDLAGNTEASQSVAVAIDTAEPTVTAQVLGTQGGEGYYRGSVTLMASGDDSGSGFSHSEYNLNGAGWVTWSTPVSLANGVNTVLVRSVDVAGNKSGESQLTVPVDTSAPVTTARLTGIAGSNGWYTSPVTMAFSVDDGALSSGVAFTEYTMDDGNTWMRWDGTPLALPGPGTITVQYRSTDVAGNREQAPSTAVNIDLAAPVVSISSAAEGSRVPAAIVEFTASDASPGSDLATVTATLDDQPAFSGMPVLGDGRHTIVVTAVDGAGLATSVIRSFVVDTSAPTIEIVCPANGSAVQTEQEVAFSVTDDDPSTTWSSSVPNGTVWTDEGTYAVTVEARDSLGNISQLTATCVIDRTAPTVSAQLNGTPGSNGWFTTEVIVALNASDPLSGGTASGVASCRYRVDGGPWTDYGTPFMVGDGQHSVYWEATDRAGNTGAASTAVYVDTVHPVAASTVPGLAQTYLYGSSLTLSLGFSDVGSGVASGLATLNGAAVTTGQTVALTQPGSNTLQIILTDNAGNTSDVSVPFTVAFSGGIWTMPASSQTTWKAGQQLKTQFQIHDFVGNPTSGAVVSVLARVGTSIVGEGVAIVRYTAGVPYYEFTIRTVKNQLGPLTITATCNDNVTLLTKTLTLVP